MIFLALRHKHSISLPLNCIIIPQQLEIHKGMIQKLGNLQEEIESKRRRKSSVASSSVTTVRKKVGFQSSFAGIDDVDESVESFVMMGNLEDFLVSPPSSPSKMNLLSSPKLEDTWSYLEEPLSNKTFIEVLLVVLCPLAGIVIDKLGKKTLDSL